MAANGFGDFSPPREEDLQKEGPPRPLSLEDAGETSDVSASLFKEVHSEEEIEEIASCTKTEIRIGKEGNSHNEIRDANTEGDSSGGEGSMFEDIDGDEEDQYPGHLGTDHSGFVGNQDRGGGASQEIFALVDGIVDEFPFIRTGRRDLDDIESLPSGVNLLRRKDDGFVNKLESSVEKGETGIKGKSKEEDSLLAGISRDYGTSSGEEGGGGGGLISLAGDIVDEGQNSTLTVPLNPPSESQETLWSEKVSTVALAIDTTSGEDKVTAFVAGQVNEGLKSGPHEVFHVEDTNFPSDTPKARVRKRGRATRELGALLLDSSSGRRGKRTFELQGATIQASGKTSAGESADTCAAFDGMGMLSTGLCGIGEVRITRSQVSGRSAVKDENLDTKVPESRGPSDMTARITGKRSVTRGGRLGWGNANESCQQGVEVVTKVEGKNSALSEAVGDDYFVDASSTPSVHGVEEPAKPKPKGKLGARAKKARGQGKAACVDSSTEAPLGSRELSRTGPVTSRAQDVEGSDVVVDHKNYVCASSSVEGIVQDTVCSLNSQETEVLDLETVVENNNLGRRRSNRQAAKAGEKVQVGLSPSCSGKTKKMNGGRKRASTSEGNKDEEVLDLNIEDQNLIGAQEIDEPSSTPQEIISILGDSGNGAGAHTFPPRRGSGRKPAKGKVNPDALGLGKKKKESAVSGKPPNVGKAKTGGRSKVKQGDVDVAYAESVNQERACGEGIVLTGADSACADQGSGKITSSVTSDTREVLQDQKEKEGYGKGSVKICDVEAAQCLWSELDAKDGCVRNTETCNSPACLGSIELSPAGTSRNVIRSRSTPKLDNVSCNENSILGGDGVCQEGTENRQKETSLQGNGGNAVGGGCREFGDDAGSATSCDSLVKKECEVLGLDQIITPDLGLPGSGGCVDPGTTETAEVAEHAEISAGGKARTRQRRVTQQQAGAKLGGQPSRKGGKREKKENTAVPQKKVASVGSKKKGASTRKGKKSSVMVTGGKDLPDTNQEIVIPATSQIADPVDGLDFVVHEGGLEEMQGEHMSSRENEKLSGAEMDFAKRRKIVVSAEVCVTSKSSPTLDLISNKCKSSLESDLLTGAKSSRSVKGGQKKSKKSLVPALGAYAVKAKTNNQSHGSSRAKGTTIKAFLSTKNRTNDTVPANSEDEIINSVNGSHVAQSGGSTLQSAMIGEAADVGIETTSLNDRDDRHELEVVQNSVNVDAVEGCQVREDIDSPEDTGVVGEDMSSGVTEGDASQEIERRTDAGVSEAGIPRKSWVLCDDCNKWRCIPVELADQIDDTNAKWSCRDNPNADYADCSIPQEKSNAEINAELQISEVSATEEGDDKDGIESKLMEIGTGSEDNKPAVWKLIRRNIFQHRRAKSQASDEIMVCQCTPPEDGGLGCGDNCLNRVLNIECVQEHCPCGEACSNQQFQKRMYAPVATFRCGKKGFGLKVLKNVSKDSFLIEYVGEVLDVGAFEERQQDYARNGQKHFYFMTLSSTEVIDACSKGNFGRFINHSCEPNCKTEKWMVNGEVCIGLFAVRDIAEGEEVTFDYNYVRVRGASAKKCECGSSQCRGFIGADSETPRDAIVESDSDEEEDLEPIMVVNSDEEDTHVDENKVTPFKKQKDDAVYREPTSTRPSRIKRKLVPLKEKGPTAVKRVKTSSSARKVSSLNTKGLTVDVSFGRHEGGRALSSDVQEKLDDLLDKRGGLKKRKDVVAQYLKLLVLSVASGDNKKDASACSVRDVSLLLEALLRTSSRSVLSDIMQMNGLRMLHTFIKQLRKQWDKTPILRKLMKVLELLSSDRVRVLTQSMINSAAPGRGMESFSESLFELTRHRDPEVCQMARRFRNKWVPPRLPVYEQYNKGADKAPQHLLKSVSPAPTNCSNQLDGNDFSSPQKQSPNAASLKAAEISKIVNGSSGLPASLGVLTAQTQSGTMLSDETTSVLPQGEVPLQNGPALETGKTENAKRKRVSRWDAPAKVEKGTYEPLVGASSADAPAADSIPSSRVTCIPSAPPIHSTGAQFQFQGSREQSNKKQRQVGPNYENGTRGSTGATSGEMGAEEMTVTASCQQANMQPQNAWQSNFPGPSTSWPAAASSGTQDSARVSYGVKSGQPQLHSGCAPGLPQRRPEPGYGIPGQPQVPQAPASLSLPPTRPSSGPPPMIAAGAVPLHPGPQQVSPANVVSRGGLPMPANIYLGCPPPHMGLGGPTLQGLHGMAPNMPMGYSHGVHFGQWGPTPGMSHFAGPPAFPMDESRRYLQQPTWTPNTSLYCEDGSRRTSTSGEVLASKGDVPAIGVQTARDMEPEPPVPGLSPPLTVPNTYDSAGITIPCPREFPQEQRMPPEFPDPKRYSEGHISSEVPETRRDREHGPDYDRARVPDIGDTGGGFREEHWDDPESQSFRDHVYFLVRSRVRRYKLRTRDIDKFCTKLADVIVRKEVAKCLEHKNQGCEKIIVRSKLVEKVESYVDNQVEQFSRKYDKSYKSGDHAR